MADRPNILILMSDEHSFRFVGHRANHGDGEPVQTPTLDALAEKGTVFETAYCQYPLCTPSRMCFLTGRHAHRCGAWSNCAILDPALTTLPGHFAANGYETCLVGKMHFGGSLQFNGFRHRPYGDLAKLPSHQPDPLRKPGAGLRSLRGRTYHAGVTAIPEGLLQEQIVVRESLAFLREHEYHHPNQPWFLCASFSRPHFPLTAPRRYFERYWPHGVTPPKVGRTGDTVDHPMTLGMRKGFQIDDIGEEEAKRARAAYFACVDYLDEILGDFLACLERTGQLQNTIVVYVTDHGEMAGEHGLWWKNTWHEASIRVPLIIQLPEQRQGTAAPKAWEAPVTMNDIFPTLCTLAGLEIPDGLDGIDLSGAARGEAGPPATPRLVSQAPVPRWGPGTEFRVVRSARYKYVSFRNAPELLFDLYTDPDEQLNLAPGATGEAAVELAELRQIASDSFNWDAVEAERLQRSRQLQEQYPYRAIGQDPNQFILPDGRLVEGDRVIYAPGVLAEDAQEAFDDWPR